MQDSTPGHVSDSHSTDNRISKTRAKGNSPAQTLKMSLQGTETNPRKSTCHNSLAMDDSIRIKHGHNLEDEAFPEELSNGITAHQELQGALHHPAGVALTRVNSGCEKHVGTAACKTKQNTPKLNRTFLRIRSLQVNFIPFEII